MTVTAIVPVLVAVLGALAYVIPGGAERRELGRLAFAVALLVAMLVFAGRAVHLGS